VWQAHPLNLAFAAELWKNLASMRYKDRTISSVAGMLKALKAQAKPKQLIWFSRSIPEEMDTCTRVGSRA
jgi:anthranilate phosphoribosyltransferase